MNRILFQVAFLATAIALTGQIMGQQRMPSELRNTLKDATVYIRTSNDEQGGTGTGFVVQKNGSNVYIATNHHVIDAERDGQNIDRKRTRLRVLFNKDGSATDGVRAELLAADELHDLAILKVVKEDAPDPFDLYSKKDLEETLPFTVFGFPLGDDQITINTGQVSGFRHNDIGAMARVKIFGKVDSGNSGGPVCDNEGRIIGVTVEKDRRADNIGYAIPAFELHELMRGRLGNFKAKQEGNGSEYNIELSADVLDPFEKLTKATLYIGTDQKISESDVKKAVSDNGTKWTKLDNTSQEIALPSLSKESITEKFNVTGLQDGRCYVQVKYARPDGETSYSEPFVIILGGRKLEGVGKRKVPLPTEKKESLLGKRVGTRGYRTSEWTVNASELIPNMMWDANALFVYLVDRNGLVRKVDPFRNQVDVEIDLGIPCRWAALSGEGLVVLPEKAEELWVLDDRSLKVRNVIDVPGIGHVTSAPTSFYAFCDTDSGKSVSVFDLVDGENTQTYPVADFQVPPNSGSKATNPTTAAMLRMTPNGRHLFFTSDGALHRFAVEDDELTYEQASDRIAQNPLRLDISEDSEYVTLPDRDGNDKTGNLAIAPGGIYVFPTRELTSPHVAVDAGQSTPVVMPGIQAIFGTVKNSPLVVFTKEGKKDREFPELDGEYASQILVYPKRAGMLLVLTDQKFYVLKKL